MSSKKSLEAKKILERAKVYLGFSRDGELVEQLGIAQSTYSMWKSRGGMDLESIITLCDGVDLNWLLHGVDPQDGDGPMKGGEGNIETIDLDLAPGEYTKRIMPARGEDGEIEYYIKAVYTRLTKEEGEEEKKRDGAG